MPGNPRPRISPGLAAGAFFFSGDVTGVRFEVLSSPGMDLEETVNELAPRVLAYCRGRMRRDDSARDVAQTALTALVDRWRRLGPPALWIQALMEAAVDPELAKQVRRYMREAHDFVADILRRAQDLGGIEPDRDPEAEAWIFVGVGMVATTSKRLGGVLTEEDLQAIASSISRWLTGRG